MTNPRISLWPFPIWPLQSASTLTKEHHHGHAEIEITRLLLRGTQRAKVKQRFAVPNVMRACSVLKNSFGWFAEITVPGYPRFTWDGRAHNAHKARDKAWSAFPKQQADRDLEAQISDVPK